MKIKKLSADFGLLEGAVLELQDGLTIVEKPNEEGKSTWCAFIRAMLYGVSSSERARAGHQPDKVRYAPWSGRPMRGEMEFEFRGQDLTITRSTRSAAAPMREFSAVYTGTGEPFPGLTGANAGETLTGATREVFERSAFIRQANVAVSGSPELETRIASLVSSGSEDECWSEADSRLRAWQRARRWNRRGRIPELENEIESKNELLYSLKDAGQRRDRLRQELAYAQAQLPEIQTQIAAERKELRRSALERLHENRRRLREGETQLNEALKRRTQASAELDTLPFSYTDTPKQAGERAGKDAAEARELGKRAEKVLPAALFAIPAVLLVLSVLCAFAAWQIAVAGAVLSIACAAVIFVLRSRASAQALKSGQGRADILKRYSADDEAGIIRRAEEFAREKQAEAEAERAVSEAEKSLSRLRAIQEESEADILSQLDISDSSRKLAKAQADIALLRENLAKAEGGLDVLGDPLVINSEKRELEDKLSELTKQYEALGLAVSALSQANTEMQTRFSPALGRRAGELFSRLTGGKYEDLSISRDFAAQVREKDSVTARSSLFLSAGAQDQMYLALRLAVCELVLDGEETCPIILDDALCTFDDERMARAMELLLELSEKRQIILFTCQGRERAYMESRGIPNGKNAK